MAIRWREDVAEHDYAAALAYLSLRLDEQRASKVVAHLRKSKLTNGFHRVSLVYRVDPYGEVPLRLAHTAA